MNGAKHTPGPLYVPWSPDGDTPAPWIVEDTDERVVVLDAQGGLIADCTNGFDGDDGWVMSAACGPLAQIIASAPELLEALQACVVRVEFYLAADGAPQVVPAWLESARAAIAKATGSV